MGRLGGRDPSSLASQIFSLPCKSNLLSLPGKAVVCLRRMHSTNGVSLARLPNGYHQASIASAQLAEGNQTDNMSFSPIRESSGNASIESQSKDLAEIPKDLAEIPSSPLDRSDHFGRKIRYPQPQNAPQAPWTPTHQLRKWKFLPRRMGFMLKELEKEQEAQLKARSNLPAFGPGAVLELSLAVPDNKGKPSFVKGIVIAKRNAGPRSTFTIKNHLGTAGGLEQTFPLYSPTIKSIKVLEERKVRRAKLYYLRDRTPKEYRV